MTKYNHHYFNLNSPLVSDLKYDQIKKIIKLETDHPYLAEKNSVQDQVGAPLTKKFKKSNTQNQCSLYQTLLMLKV